MMDSLDDISSITTLVSEEDEIFWSRFNCIQNWFLKASTKIKLKLLISMLDSIKDESYLIMFLSSCNFALDKLIMYSECQATTNYIYDIKLKDHNRGLQTEFLQTTIRKDILWYNTLEPHEQIRVLSELLRISGGAIIKIIYGVILDRVRNNDKAKYTAQEVEEVMDKVDLNQFFLPKTTESGENGTKDEKKSKTPLELEIEQKKKVWEDEMRKYRIAVEGRSDKQDTAKGKGKDASSGKSSKTNKTDSKKAKKGDKNLVDRVQMLPIWVVKKIFSYLDNKALKKVSEVNSYWAYVVDDIGKDRKNMAAVQKIVKKMQANLSGNAVPDLIPSEGEPVKLTQVEKKMMKLVERGAVDPRLKTIIKQPAEGKTLLERAITLPDTHLRFPTQGYEAFPRAQGALPSLLTLPNAFYTEAGVLKYGKKPEGGAVTIVELTNYSTIDCAMQTTDHDALP